MLYYTRFYSRRRCGTNLRNTAIHLRNFILKIYILDSWVSQPSPRPIQPNIQYGLRSAGLALVSIICNNLTQV